MEVERMKKDLTELVFILDRSGSMNGLESDTIGGFNSFIDRQKDVDGKCLVSVVLFNSESTVIYDREPLEKIRKMTMDDYMPGGSTALIDAMGDTIHHIRNVHRYIRKEDVPDKTVFVIITDGMENDSHHYSSDEVKRMVSNQKEKGWEFLFLGANIDAVETAKEYGIGADRSVRFHNDSRGIKKNFTVLSKVVEDVRINGPMGYECLDEIRQDYESRK